MHTALVATALAVATVTPTSPAAPVAAPADPPAPPAPAVVSRADVDGDLRPDTIRLERRRVTADEYTFRITVTTATGRRAVRDVIVPNYGDGSLTPADVWNGTADIDGVRGAEINVERSGNVGDVPWPHVYTWRAGRLVPQTAPDAGPGDTGWTVADHFTLVAGYAFTTVKGRRQMTATHLDGHFVDRETLRYRGTRVTYRWENGTWRRIRTARTATMGEDQARRFAGWQGITWRR